MTVVPEPAPVTVLFADISGSTLLYALRGDEQAFAVTSACLAVLEAEVASASGRVVKRVGDAILAVFPAPDAGVDAAVRMLRALESAAAPLRDERIHVRVGIASGTAVLDAGDVYGDVVNVAARLVGLAGPDEIFLAGECHDGLAPELRTQVRLIDQLALRGRPDAVAVYQYLWKDEETTVMVGERRRDAAALEVRYGAQVFTLDRNRPKLTIGRDQENDIAIAEEAVSRHHAEVVLRGDKFLLVDRSTNGTWVVTDAGETIRICREELTLIRGGRILPGRETVTPVHYRGAQR